MYVLGGAENIAILRDQKPPEEQQEKERKWENGSGDRKESRQREIQEALDVEQGELEKIKDEMVVLLNFI